MLAPPSLHSALTVVLSLVLLFLVLWLFNPFSKRSELEQLVYVGESAGRMMDRHLQFYVGYADVPPSEKQLHAFLFGARAQVEAEAIATYREVLAYFASHPEHTTPWAQLNTRTRLLVTLAETGRRAELEQALQQLGDNPDEEVIGEAIRFAYFDTHSAADMPAILAGASLLPLGWAADQLRWHIARKTGELRVMEIIERRLHARARQQRERLFRLVLLVAGTSALGCFLLWRHHLLASTVPWSTTLVHQPWRFREGVAVMVRTALLGLLIVLALQLLAQQYFKPGVLAAWSTLFASLPMLWLVQQRLLKPRGLRLCDAFGLRVGAIGWRRLASVSLGFIALDWFGGFAISWLGWQAGIGGHWAEAVHERMVFGPAETVWLSAINIVVWAAIFEEIGFRGLLYPTLRLHLAAKFAIPLSALIFSTLHLYSITGFLTVFWSGMVLAFVYERTRSLLPCMLIHAAGNLLSLSMVLLFYT